MPHVEIFKSGVLTKRLDVSRPKAEAGCVVRLGSAGKVTLRLGEQTRLGEYDVRLVEDTDGSGGPAPGVLDAGAAKPDRSEKVPRLEGYEIQHRLGEGGMGAVWQGIQLSTKRAVAIKFLSSRAFDSERAQRRFTREVELSAKLEHPNIARIYDSGLRHGAYYYAMELVPGVPLDEYVEGSRLDQRKILKLMRTVAEAIQHAHERGVIHRDLKPSNIMVGPDGRPHIVDFGLAKSLLVDETEKQLTVSIEGDVSGTPAYMSPEQAAGRLEEIDSRTDVYSLGVMLYRLLVGHPPHELSGTRYSVMKRIVEEEIRSPRELGVSINADLEGLLRKCLARSPADRYATAGDLARDIDNYLHGNPLVARKATFVYRMGKRMARHRAMAGVAACVAVLLVPLLAGLLPGGWIRRGMTETRTVEVVQTPVVKEVIVPATQPQAQGTAGGAASIKDQADAAWDDVKKLDRGQGLGKQLDAAVVTRLSAQTFFDQHAYDLAAENFRQFLKLCDDLRATDAARRKAADVRQAWQQSANTAKQAGAPNIAADLWSQSQSLSGKADERFAAGDFAGAQLLWTQAAEAIGKVTLPDHRAIAGDATDHHILTNSIGMKFVEIKPGTFLMGSPADEAGRNVDETQHKVTLTKGFWMGITHVTRGQFATFVKSANYKTDAEKEGWAIAWTGEKIGWVHTGGSSWRNPGFEQEDDHPVVEVSWNDAVAFCQWLSKTEGTRYRLPTEAEWEYCCRAGTHTAYWWGNSADAGVGCANGFDQTAKRSVKLPSPFNWPDGYVFTSPVGKFMPNAWGLYDMAGNVWQWCNDGYTDYPNIEANDPAGEDAAPGRVLRGGSWSDTPESIRCAKRYRFVPSRRDCHIGFRVVLDTERIPPVEPAAQQSPPISLPVSPDQAAALQLDVAKQLGIEPHLSNSIGLQLELIPRGTVAMSEKYTAVISHPFYIGKYKVTVGQFRNFAVASGYQTDAERRGWGWTKTGDGRFLRTSGVNWRTPGFPQTDENPVVYVSWNDAKAFCEWLTKSETGAGTLYRLPTEAEWVWACRAGATTRYFFGDNPSALSKYAWFGRAPTAGTKPIGLLLPNSWGLFDTLGDTTEWVQDWLEDYHAGVLTDPQGPPHGAMKLACGGGYDMPAADFTGNRVGSVFRGSCDYSIFGFGFRIVREAGNPSAAKKASAPRSDAAPAGAAVPDAPSRKFTNSIGMEFVEIKPGSFLMGSPETEYLRKAVETQHKVTLTKSFFIETTTVTQAQWQALLGRNAQFVKFNNDLPVTMVSYDDALAFCKELSKTEGRQYQLPTEAEWEYACRAGTTTTYYTGDGVASADEAGWSKRNSNGVLHPVAKLLPNAWGLYDMHGNVWQWCSDWYAPYTRDEAVDPQGPAFGRARIARGGSFDSDGGPTSCRSASRAWFDHNRRSREVGFRLIMDAASVPRDSSAVVGVFQQPRATTQPAFQPAGGTAVVRAPDTAGIQPEFSDNFAQTRLWGQGKDPNASWGYGNGTYEVQLYALGRQWCWSCPGGLRNDFVCEIQVISKGQHPNAYCGINLFSTDSGSVAIMFSEEGQVRATSLWNDSHKNERVPNSLPNRLAADLVRPVGAVNTLTVRMKGAYCEVFLNNVRVIEPFNIKPFVTPVWPGLAVQGGSAGAEVEFHSCRVWLLKDHPQLAN